METTKFTETTFLEQTFSGTTVNIQHVLTVFVYNSPSYFKNGLAAGTEGKTLINLHIIGKLETCLREYVCGKVNTLTPLLAEAVNLEKSSPLVAPALIKIAFLKVDQLIHRHELFELVVRYREAEASCMSYLKLASCN